MLAAPDELSGGDSDTVPGRNDAVGPRTGRFFDSARTVVFSGLVTCVPVQENNRAMPTEKVTEQRVFFDLDADMQREIARLPLADVLRGQGLDMPPDVRFGEAALPSAEPGVREKDWGPVLIAAPGLLLALGTAASAVILAISKYLKDREHAPKVIYVHRVREITGADGESQLVLVKDPIVVEHGPQSRIEMEAALKGGEDLVVRLTAEH